MAKVRVYELAKELGVESKTVLSMLKDMGEFVRSASSTVEAPVERRLKEKLASEPPPANRQEDSKEGAGRKDGRRGAGSARAGAGRGGCRGTGRDPPARQRRQRHQWPSRSAVSAAADAGSATRRAASPRPSRARRSDR